MPSLDEPARVVFQGLQEEDERESVDAKWEKLKETYVATCKAVLGQKKYHHKEWITEKSLQLVIIRKKRKAAQKLMQRQIMR